MRLVPALLLVLAGALPAAADTDTFTLTASATATSTSTHTSSATTTPTHTATRTATATVTSTCAAGCYGYVTNAGSGFLSIIDTVANAVAAQPFVGLNGFDVKTNAAGTRAYVSVDGRPGSLKVLDISSPAASGQTVIQGLRMGQQPRFIAVNGSGSIQAVTNFNLDGQSGINVTGPGNSTVTTGAGPWGLAFTPNGSWIYVANHKRGASSTVSVVDTTDLSAVTQVSVGGGPRFVGITPNGSLAYVSNETGGSVSVIDTTVKTVTDTVSTGAGSKPWYVLPMADGSYVYVVRNVSGSGGVSKIRVADQTVVATVPTGSGPQFCAVSPNGSRLYVPNVNSGTLSVVNTQLDTVAATISLGTGTRPLFCAVNPNGSFVYVTRNTSPGYVNVLLASSNAIVATIRVGAFPAFLAVKP